MNHTWTVGYDTNGRMTGRTDPLNHQTAVAMNAAGQITQLTDPQGAAFALHQATRA